MTAPTRSDQPAALANREGIERFDVSWRWATGTLAGGFTAVLRVKNEARSLPHVLRPLLRTLDRVLIIDNQSTDGTADVARVIATEMQLMRKLDVITYPFEVARCGSEHLHTPPDSVHSLTYFYNWAFSHVDTGYALKWDGDMVLTGAGEQALDDLSWRLESTEAVIVMPRIPLWVVSDTTAFADVSLRNVEPWGWPNRRGYWFGKGLEWEIQLRPGTTPSVALPEWSCFELKWLDEDEFAHWTSPSDFEDTLRTSRKRREWEVYQALGRGEVPPGVVPITATGGLHVIDVVRRMSPVQWRRRLDEQPAT